MLTQERLQEVLDYHSEGYLTWKSDKGNGVVAGSVAGSLHKSTGYQRLQIDGKEMRLHRAIYLLQKGTLPAVIDHVNQNKLDNRIENLRAASVSQNTANQSKKEGCSSKHKGVSWYKGRNKWGAGVTLDGKRKHLGYFECEHEAAHAYNTAVLKHHGEFACLNPFNNEDGGL